MCLSVLHFTCVILTALEHLRDCMFVWFYKGPRGVVRTDEIRVLCEQETVCVALFVLSL